MPVENQHIVTRRFADCVKALVDTRAVASARQLALALDYTPQGLSEILLGKRNVPLDLLHKTVEKFHLNLQYLFAGDGDPLGNIGQPAPLQPRVVVTDQIGRERIAHVPVLAYAGYRDNLTEPVYIQNLPTYSLPENILREGSYRSFEVAGESMEPTLYQGDKVIGAIVEQQYWEQGLKDNGIYVLVTQHEVVVKRILNFISGERMLELHSDNPGYPPYHLPIAELREAWVARLRMTSNLARPEGFTIAEFDDRLHEQAMLLEELRNAVDRLKLKVID